VSARLVTDLSPGPAATVRVVEHVVTALIEHLAREDPGGTVGLYLHGSAVTGGLRADSDLDLLLTVRRTLTDAERTGLTTWFLSLSGWRGHAQTFPEVSHRRPVELTVVVTDHHRWTGSSRFDLQLGEWMRAELVAGTVPGPGEDPDVVLLL